jgi:thiamine-monophosphate kinase
MNALREEFDWIDRLKPLARGDPRALGLLDDAAVIPGRPGHDLVVSKDAMVEGVHFLAGESAERVAQRLLRTALSDLAAKAAAPFGYFLMTAWPPDRSSLDQDAFIRGLARDGEEFGVALLGGDTVRTPGPLALSATVLGWVPDGRAVLRSGARAGDLVMVCGEIADPGGRLAAHYRTPLPLLALREVLRGLARAAADVSDGLLADVDHIARASGLGVSLDLDLMPLSANASAWLGEQADGAAARLALAAGGDDYAIACAVDPADEAAFRRGARERGTPAARVGVFEADGGLRAGVAGRPAVVESLGWRH